MTAAHLTLAGRPGPSPHTRIVSGPNVKLAMARALLLKATTTAPVVLQWVKRGASLVAKTPGWVGHAILGALSTPAGYSTAIQLVGTGTKMCWRLLDRVACLSGRGVASLTGLVASAVRHIAPTWGQALVSAHADAVDTVNALHEQAVQRVNMIGQQLEELTHTPLVKTTATRAAATASGLLVLHVITKGLLASKALEVAPSLAGPVIAAASPWWLVLAVAAVTVGTIAGTAYLNRGGNTLAGDLIINVATDGSITVTGIPRKLPKADQERVASGAGDAALACFGLPPRNSSRPPRSTQRHAHPGTARP